MPTGPGSWATPAIFIAPETVREADSSTSPKMEHLFSDPYHAVTLRVLDSNGIWSQPETTKLDLCAPDKPATTGTEYAALVACVEERLTLGGNQPPRKILAIVRGLYYGMDDWSSTRRPNWPDVIRAAGRRPSASARSPGSARSSTRRSWPRRPACRGATCHTSFRDSKRWNARLRQWTSVC